MFLLVNLKNEVYPHKLIKSNQEPMDFTAITEDNYRTDSR